MNPVFLRRRCAAVVAAALVCSHAVGQSVGAGSVFAVNQPWVVPSGGKKTTEAYMDLTSSQAAWLVAAQSSSAARVALRFPAGAGDGELALPEKVTVRLAPGAHRLVLMGLTRQLKVGDRVELTLAIRDQAGARQSIPVDAEVRLDSPLEHELRAHRHTH